MFLKFITFFEIKFIHYYLQYDKNNITISFSWTSAIDIYLAAYVLHVYADTTFFFYYNLVYI